ncbi:unnamed protein product, partial [Meganyctiphanes norvegica]
GPVTKPPTTLKPIAATSVAAKATTAAAAPTSNEAAPTTTTAATKVTTAPNAVTTTSAAATTAAAAETSTAKAEASTTTEAKVITAAATTTEAAARTTAAPATATASVAAATIATETATLEAAAGTATVAVSTPAMVTAEATNEVLTTVPTTQPPTTLKPIGPTTRPPTTLKPIVPITQPPTTLKPTAPATRPPTTLEPTVNPTEKPTVESTTKLPEKTTDKPTEKPTEKPTDKPTVEPTKTPTVKPTLKPTENPNPSTEFRAYCDDCGTSAISVARRGTDTRIIGGQEATPGEYPWQVLLLTTATNFGSSVLRCGGSVIKKRWILSASHCFSEEGVGTVTSLKMHLGAHNFNDLSDVNMKIIEYTQEDAAARIKLHPDYDDPTVDNDISLIELKEDLVFTSRISPVCLGDVKDFVAGKQGVATGWGKVAASGFEVSDVLLEVGLELIELAVCQDLYTKTPVTYGITDNMVCTLSTGKDACGGDSGGPLVVQLADGRWVQVGITSFGYSCAFPDAPGVWANVAKYKTWIDQTTGSDQC